MTAVLVTGGAGYIGSHTVVELVTAGYTPVIYDNFCNSHPDVIDRLKTMTGSDIACVRGDVRDADALAETMRCYDCRAVLHFAGLKAVGESVTQPLRYYADNVVGTVSLLQAMAQATVRVLVFSSSATVYGTPQYLPLDEKHPLSASNPYGRTKIVIEDMLRDIAAATPDMAVAILRYFNPAGAHDSGLIGEDPQGLPNNLMPYIASVAAGTAETVHVFGNDYPTPDGTGVRDYIHVVDLARGHIAALDKLMRDGGVVTVNLGTGRGYSVLEMISAYARAAGRDIPHRLAARRTGDVAACYADPAQAAAVLGWRAARDIDDMCKTSWRWITLRGGGKG